MSSLSQHQRPHHQRSATLPTTAPRPTARSGGESDSWIEIPSHPSDTSSSESEQHIITSGLRINRRKRRNTNSTFRDNSSPLSRPHTAPYDTSEDSEASADISDSSDDNERPEDVASFIATQLSSSGFTTSSASTDDEASGSDSEDGRTVFASPRNRAPHPSQSTAEHDAALRASLSTLLSCAAAARGLPKKPGQTAASAGRGQRAGGSGPVEGIRVLHESDLPTSSKAASVDEQPSTRQTSSIASNASSDALTDCKKKSVAKRRNSAAARAKKLREMSTLNASLLTLAFSAGAVVVLTAIGFSAGYWVGREAGRGETFFGAVQGARSVRRVGRVAG